MNSEPPAYTEDFFEERITHFLQLRMLRSFCLLAIVITIHSLLIFREMLLLISGIVLGSYIVSFLLTFSRHQELGKYLLIITAISHLFITASFLRRAAGEQMIYIRMGSMNLYYDNLVIIIFCFVGITLCYFYLSKLQQVQFLQTIQVNKEVEEVINYFATSVFQANTPEEILWDISRNCISKFGFNDCKFYLMKDNKTMLMERAAYGPKNPTNLKNNAPIEISVGKGIVGSVAATGQPEIVVNTSKDSRYIVNGTKRLSEIAVPLIYQGEVFGVIYSGHSERNFFQPKHLNILRIVAAFASNKIAAARAQEKHRKGERIDRETERLKEVDITSADERFLHKAIEIVENQMYDPNFNVEIFIKQMPLQYSQSSRKLKAMTGQTPVQFIRLMRLERAAQKLICQEDNVTQIAYSVGFNNLSWFAKCFKEQYGKSPSDYMNSVD